MRARPASLTRPKGPGLCARLRERMLVLMATLAVLVATTWPALAERRVALVIGNSSYTAMPALQNPRNDANDMAATLRDLGFEVMVSTDMKRGEVRDVLARFSTMASGADTALVYYAGHALEVRGQYYLVPVDATIEPGSNLRYVMMPVADLREVVSSAKGLRLMIFDACRNDPSEGTGPLTPEAARAVRQEELQKALTGAEGGKGIVVAYATAPFDVAEDGKARNSPFTGKLLKWLKEPELEIRPLFRRVSRDVYVETGGRQMPEVTLALQGDYFLNRAESHDTVWLRIRRSEDPSDFRDFLARYPLSIHAPKATRRLDMLERDRRIVEERARREAERRAKEDQERREAERRRLVCAEEAARVEGLRQAGRRDDLERLQAGTACPEQTGPQVEAVLAALQEQEAQERRQREALEATRRAEQERQKREQQEAEARRQREAAELDRHRQEQESLRQRQEQDAQRQRHEAEKARLAEMERRRREQEAEAQRQRQAAELERQRQEQEATERQRRAACEAEAGRIAAAAAAAAPREALAALQNKLACPDNVPVLAGALATVEEAARAICARETEQYGAIDRTDALALSTFAGRAQCRDVAAAARTQVQRLQGEREQAEQACTRDAQEMESLRRLGAEGRAGLERLGTATTCATLRPQVVATLGSLLALPQQNTRDQLVRAGAALRRLGCLAERGDLPLAGIQKGLTRYYAALKMEPVALDIDDALLRRLDGEPDRRICPLMCEGDEVERDGKCIRPPPARPAQRPGKPDAKPESKPAGTAAPKPPREDTPRSAPAQREAPPAPPVASSAPPKRSPSIILGN